MSQTALIIKNEYLTDVRAKSFWISTFVFPLVMVLFGGVIGYLSADSDIMRTTANPMMPEDDEVTGAQLFGMLIGIFLTLFIMMYGAQIFNKVKEEKCNRIVEILATCVPGRTMMLAKIVAVGLVGITQILLWMLLIGILVAGIAIVFQPDIPWDELLSPTVWMGLIWGVLFFTGGYIFFGSLYAAVGAMTDKNNENQEYMTVLTFILLASFYLGEFVVTHAGSTLSLWCTYIPFTSPTVGAVNVISGGIPLWQGILSLVSLYLFAFLALAFAGKIYTSTLLLRGKRLTPKDILVFLRSK